MSKFIDTHQLLVTSGNGAPGSASFRREKYVPFGGPDGGDGGRGGDVLLRVNPSLNSLFHLYSFREIKAQAGHGGMGRKKHGKDGEDVVIEVPLGTLVKDSEGGVLFDMSQKDQEIVLLEGGLGGKGNVHFTSSSNQAPRYAQPGLAGKSIEIQLEMKLIADLGLVGFPNAGKSTFLSTVSNARPKIADYPFTTLTPQLGIHKLDATNSLLVADIPGIIEGAHEGVGLGLEFLRHIERTWRLLFLVDSSADDPLAQFRKLRKELRYYSERLFNKPFRLGLSKMDIANRSEAEIRELFPEELHDKMIFFSSAAHIGYDNIRNFFYEIIQEREKEKSD